MNDRRRTADRYERKRFKRFLLRQIINTGDVSPKEAAGIKEWFQRSGIPSHYDKKERRLTVL